MLDTREASLVKEHRAPGPFQTAENAGMPNYQHREEDRWQEQPVRRHCHSAKYEKPEYHSGDADQ